MNFTWKALKGAETALNRLRETIRRLKTNEVKQNTSNKKLKEYENKFLEYINDDLNIPKALALTWNLIKEKNLSNKNKYRLLLDFDKVFGLKLNKVKKIKIPQKIKDLVKKREEFRKKDNWKKSDELRKQIEKLGYKIEDAEKGTKIKKL